MEILVFPFSLLSNFEVLAGVHNFLREDIERSTHVAMIPVVKCQTNLFYRWKSIHKHRRVEELHLPLDKPGTWIKIQDLDDKRFKGWK